MGKAKSVDFGAGQAMQLAEAHEVEQLLSNEEEVELLEEHNPELLEAYRALWALANS